MLKYFHYLRISKELGVKSILFNTKHGFGTDMGLLIARLSIGLLMAFSHGLGKMQKLVSGEPIQFADPIGLGQELSLFLAGTSEFVLSLFLCIGFLTRIVSIPLAFTMAVAVFVVHANDPFNRMEFGLLYLVPYIMFFFTGAGRFSVDHLISSK